MGAKDYPSDLAPRLELFWGIRHVAVHMAGVTTADFVKRHPGVVKAPGERVRLNTRDSGSSLTPFGILFSRLNDSLLHDFRH